MSLKSFFYLFVLVFFFNTLFVALANQFSRIDCFPTVAIGLTVYLALTTSDVKSLFFVALIGLLGDSSTANTVVGPNITCLVAVYLAVTQFSHRLFINSNLVLFVVTILAASFQVLLSNLLTFGYSYFSSHFHAFSLLYILGYGFINGVFILFLLPLIKKIVVSRVSI